MKPKQAGNGLYSADAFDDDNGYASDNDYNIPKVILHADFTACPFVAATFPILLQSQN
jgi:hypothetical protein